MFQPLSLNHWGPLGECALFNKRCGQKSIQKIVSSEEQKDVWREFDEQLFYRFNFVWEITRKVSKRMKNEKSKDYCKADHNNAYCLFL